MKPILFSTPMVQAILDGRKTMTRRVAKGRNYKVDYVPETYNHLVKANVGDFYYFTKDKIRNGWGETINFYDAPSLEKLTYAMREHNDFPFNIGDVLWVRETWQNYCLGEPNSGFIYKASPELYHWKKESVIWKPSIFMPKEACRIFLRVTNVRVERLQDISVEDCEKEGCRPSVDGDAKDWLYDENGWHRTFRQLWNSINGKGAWEENPYVFVYTFQRIEKPN